MGEGGCNKKNKMGMKFKTLIKLSNGKKIQYDKFNWVFDTGDKNNKHYYHTLDELLDDVLETEVLSKVCTSGELKDFKSVRSLIWKARETTRNDIEAIEKMLTSADMAKKRGEI